MPHLELSPAVSLAWRLAANEALRSGHSLIEPEHLFLGACSLDKALAGEHSLSPEAISATRQEWETLASVMRSVRCDPISLRRRLRSRFSGASDPIPAASDTRISRSTSSRHAFALAAASARDHRAPFVGLMPFCAALLDQSNTSLLAMLEAEGVEPGSLRESISYHRSTASAYSNGSNRLATITNSPLADSTANTETRHDPSVTETLDATVAVSRSDAAADADRRLSLFYELPWQYGLAGDIDDLLQKMLERLIDAVPAAQRGNVLIADSRTGELLLKAHLPAGAPAVSLTSVQEAMDRREGFIWHRTENLTSSQQEHHGVTGIYAPLIWNGSAFGAVTLDNYESGQFTHDDLRLVVAVAHQAAMAVANRQLTDDLRRKNDLLERLMTSFSPRIRSRLLEKASHGRLRPGGERSEVTILCSDIRGFTQMTKGMDTEAIVDMLNEYFSCLTEAIFRNDGTIDKFMGDAILAVFGSPEPDAQHSAKAVAAAVDMQAAMREMNRVRALTNHPLCEIGIGVHCGEVLHGFIGAAERMEFTVIGDTVNRASRYCSGAAAGQVLISPELHQRVWKLVEAESTQIPTKHEGNFAAFIVKRLKAESARNAQVRSARS